MASLFSGVNIMEPETMSILEIKKYFTKNSNVNFLNDYTLQDVEDAKKHIFMRNYKGGETLKYSLDKMAEKMAKEKFYAGIKEEQGVAVKNTVRDVLNANYKNTITRLIMVDSQYRMNLQEEATHFMVQLNEKVVNAISLELVHFQLPYTFYNIEARQGNNHLIVTTMEDPENPVNHEVTLDDGHYSTMEQILTSLETKLNAITDTRIAFTVSVSPLTGRVQINNTGTIECVLSFLTGRSKINHCLGWHLGFRNYQGTSLANRYISMEYTVPLGGNVQGGAVAMVPHTKYFVVVVEDFNNNQTADTLVQNNIKPENSKPTSYFTQDPLLDKITPENLSSYLANVPNRTLTKSQLYTISQQNMEKINMGYQNARLEVHAPNQVLATIPFEASKASWGDMVFTDKNKYLREYHSPTNIDRLEVKIYDDKGYLIHLNGSNWCMTLLTNNLYKY